MVINFIIIGGNTRNLKKDIFNMRKIITDIGGQVLYTVLISLKKKIADSLLYEIENTVSNVLLIIGDISVRDVTSAIENRISQRDISTDLPTMLSNLEEILTLIQPICKVRNQTLIIDMSGLCTNAIICLKENGYAILHAAHLIAKNKTYGKESSSTDISSTALSDTQNLEKRLEDSSCVEIDVLDAVDLIQTVIYNEIDVNKIDIEIVNINDAYGRILCENVHSKCDVPPFRTAVKHGYAVLASDGKGIKRVVRVPTTSTPFILEYGTCVWVKSGAPIPDGATAVVQVANTRIKGIKYDIDNVDMKDDDNIEIEEKYIEILIKPQEGENIRPIGCEVKNGAIILDRFKRIGTAEIGLLASCGHMRIKVIKLPCTGVMSIGNDLEEPGEDLRSGHAYDSNRITLITLLKENDFECTNLGIVAYDMLAIIRNIKEALERVDVLVTIGCANNKDMLKSILMEYFRVTIHFGGVNMKPGKSTTFATCKIADKEKYILCLSGNPGTVPITAHLFVLPLLNMMRRYFCAPNVRIPTYIKSCYDLHSRPKYAWTTLRWGECDTIASAVHPTHQNSNILRHRNANALIELPSCLPDENKIYEVFETALYIG